jgi:hypothetical protein
MDGHMKICEMHIGKEGKTMRKKEMKCANSISNKCTKTFVLTAREEAYYMKNYGKLPFRCPECRRVAKLLRGKLPEKPVIKVKPHFTERKEKRPLNPMFSMEQLMEMKKVCEEK